MLKKFCLEFKNQTRQTLSKCAKSIINCAILISLRFMLKSRCVLAIQNSFPLSLSLKRIICPKDQDEYISTEPKN